MGNGERIGVFYDGTWFAYVSDYFATVHPRAARVSLDGFHDSLRWYVHTVVNRPLDECVVSEAHYVRGRIETPAVAFDAVLAAAGVVRHDMPLHSGKEKGVDVHLALEAWERATSVPLQWVVLVTGDADFAPLASRLVARGVRVIVPVVDGGGVVPAWTPRTAAPLRAAASATPTFDDLFEPAESTDYPLRAPFVRTSGSGASVAGEPRGRRKGTITGWKPGQPHGFITDTRGASWFVSRDDLADGSPALPIGTTVTFSGPSTPPSGHKYPRAYAVQTESGVRFG
ncbi:MAG: NYN domain-containing protein [Saccharothrix sp.]|nr:NYN domain-containing protein [Saccharothrix sp.]